MSRALRMQTIPSASVMYRYLSILIAFLLLMSLGACLAFAGQKVDWTIEQDGKTYRVIYFANSQTGNLRTELIELYEVIDGKPTSLGKPIDMIAEGLSLKQLESGEIPKNASLRRQIATLLQKGKVISKKVTDLHTAPTAGILIRDLEEYGEELEGASTGHDPQ